MGVRQTEDACLGSRVVRTDHAAGLGRYGREMAPLVDRIPGNTACVASNADFTLTVIAR